MKHTDLMNSPNVSLKSEPYGYELVLDLFECDRATFTRKNIDGFFEAACRAAKMVKCERYWWDDIGISKDQQQTSPHTQGTSAVQFILTSSIVIHTLDQLGLVFINMFSCKKFDPETITKLATTRFKSPAYYRSTFLTRG
jgi:S-adenosylmethionine/arginine decarboxylase-like enzyme